MNRVLHFARSHRLEFFLILVITLLALALRLYRIDEYLTFLGDEGRDVRVVRDLLSGNLVFIGPRTSFGDMYLGPFYYYLMAPFLWAWHLSPTGPAVMVALLGALAVTLTWWVGRTWFSPLAGLMAALLFALSPIAIHHARFSWNPNPLPLVSLLAIWLLYHLWRHHRLHLLPLLALLLGIALQLHYLALFLLPTIALFWLLTLRRLSTSLRPLFLRQSLLGLLIFLAFQLPLLLFDLKHNFLNLTAFRQLFSSSTPDSTLTFPLLASLTKVVSDLLLAATTPYALPAAILLLILSLFYLIRTHSHKPAYLLLLTWLGFGLFGLTLYAGLYRQPLYAHYFGFIFPALYLLTGFLISRFLQSNWAFRLLALGSLVFLLYLSLLHSPLRFAPNRQLQKTEAAVDLIIRQSQGQDFNFALIAEKNYDESYRFFLENKHASFFRGEDKITDQLFVVCEDEVCQPEGHPEWQIAVFGPSHTTHIWQLDHLRIFRLEPTR